MALAVERLPRFTDPAADAYAETLDRALTASDSRGDLAGTGVAERLGLNPDAATALRRAYLTALAITLRDLGGGDEQLSAAADLLGVRVEETTFREGDGESPWQLRAGDTVVFAGTLYPSRDRWLREARAAGLVVGNAVTRRTRLMVTADPDSRTGNAEKARRYQVPIVHPAAYQEILRRTSARWVRRNSRLP
jgi:DNA polymerase-3 subunit epsilon